MSNASWPGAGTHSGHTVTRIDQWAPRIENATVVLTDQITISNGTLTSGRVRCSCGDEWNVGGWPPGCSPDLMDDPL